MKKIIITLLLLFSCNIFIHNAEARTGAEIAEMARQKREAEYQEQLKKKEQQDYEMKKITTPAFIIGGFIVLGIVLYALITKNSKSQQINIYNDRKSEGTGGME